MSMLPMEDQPQYQPSGALDQLAYSFAQQPVQNTGPDNSAIIPGMGVNVTPPNKQAMLGNYLQNLGMQHVQRQKQIKGKQFLKGVHDIMSGNMPPEERINHLIQLKAQHGDDYGLGLDEILTQLGKQNDKKIDGWKPQTQQEALDFEAAKFGQKPVSVQDKKFELDLKDRAAREKNSAISIIDSSQNIIDTIAEVEAGINNFGLTGDLPSLPGSKRANWESNIKKLLSSKVLDRLKSMKEDSKTGASGLGALAVRELEVLTEASTALRRNLSPQDAQRYLSQMKESAVRLLETYKQTVPDYVGPARVPQPSSDQVQGKQLDPNTAMQILQAAGGDPNKAREIAKNQGFIF